MNKYIYPLFALALLITISCKNQDNQIDQKEVTKVQEAQMPKITEGITAEEMAILITIKADFDALLNHENKTNRSLGEQYELHAAGLGNSFLQNNPITLNLPYNNKIRLSDYDDLLLNSNLWSYKCGYQEEDGSQILNFYCLNTSGPIFNYLQNASPNNELIHNFITSYKKIGDFSPDIQQSTILNTPLNIDFNNPDHQMFWVIYHLSLNETMNASNELKSYRAKKKKTPM